jgi:hypothetical protein
MYKKEVRFAMEMSEPDHPLVKMDESGKSLNNWIIENSKEVS